MGHRGLGLVVGACAALVAACTPDIPEGHFSCATDTECPSGWVCRQPEGRCYSTPGGEDAGPGADAGGCTRAADCEDGDPCTTDACDVASGTCSSTPRADCMCDDGDGDGYGEGPDCFGPDCDDADPAVSPGADDPPDIPGDANCDGAEGNPAAAYFVSPDGADVPFSANPDAGTIDFPFLTIQFALHRASEDATRTNVYVAQGTYAERVTLREGTSLYGRFAPDFSANESRFVTEIASPETIGLRVEMRRTPGVVSGFTIRSADATAPGASSRAILLRDVTAALELRDLELFPGRGADGASPPAPPDAAAGGPGLPGTGGQCGGAATGDFPGGPGGEGCGEGPNGGAGALADLTGDGRQGGLGLNSSGAAVTVGGAAGSCVDCNHGAAGAGDPGAIGVVGVGAAEVAAAEQQRGTLSDTGDWSAGGGAAGNAGGPGNGGGGGGSGCASSTCSCNATPAARTGGSGGGGGGGGCGGAGSPGGGGGGGSFGVVALMADAATLTRVLIHGGRAGDGGAGAPGGAGGVGGAGATAVSGNSCLSCATGNGGAGGRGGAGGEGGPGGGGAGGMAVGVLRNMSPALTLTDVEFRMAEATPGAAGAGGSAPGVPGPMGTRGLAADEVSVE